MNWVIIFKTDENNRLDKINCGMVPPLVARYLRARLLHNLTITNEHELSQRPTVFPPGTTSEEIASALMDQAIDMINTLEP